MSYCKNCGAYIPVGETLCPACRCDIAEASRRAGEEKLLEEILRRQEKTSPPPGKTAGGTPCPGSGDADDHLKHAQDAIRRAKLLMDVGEPEQAFTAYLEAADHMLRFAELEGGAHRASARKLTRELIKNARDAKALAEERKRPAAPDKPPEGETAPDAARPEGRSAEKPGEAPRESNQSAISRDLESWRRSGKPGSEAENRLKFTPVASPNVHFSDIAGLENVKNLVRMKVIEPILHPELFERFSKDPNGGILLYGPPGTGKTMIARAIATETRLDFFSVRCSDIVGKTFGDGERNLKGLFDAARESGRAMIFFDEFESLACRRGGSSTIMNRIVPELLSQMDGFQKFEGLLVILASTNRPWDLDSAVLRPPRMTERIYVGLPDFAARHYMVKKALEPLPKQELLDYDRIADALEGFNCADIAAFVERVKEAPIRRGLIDHSVDQYITAQDVEDALANSRSSVQKSDLEAFSKWEAAQR